MTSKPPGDLSTAGASLWRSIQDAHELDAQQETLLVEVCRAKDRLDKLDELLRGDVEVWAQVMHRTQTEEYQLHIDDALAKANATANTMKQLLAAMRLPDSATGKRPQRRGGGRGSYAPRDPKVSSLDRARTARSS